MSLSRLLGVFAAPITALALAGCGAGQLFGVSAGTTDTVKVATSRQLVVGDEPFAVNAAVSVLAQGGNAVDAATSLFFALSVTYPAAVGVGGGGLCIARDASGVVGEFDFLPRAANRGGAYAVPMAVRGFYDMQKRLGSIPWQRTVSPAEALADAGFPLSQALAARLAGTESVIRLDAALAAELLDESGQLKKAGTMLTNPALARTLAIIRQEGADGFAAKVGANLIAYSTAQGGGIGPDDFAAAKTRQVAPARRAIGGMSVSYPATGTGAGAFSATLLARMATSTSTPASAGANAVAAVQQALAGFGVATIPADFGSTAFAVTDGMGGAVSCAVTLNGPFGAGRTATGTGVALAAAPSGPSGLASAFLMPVLGQGGDASLFIGAAAGGPNGSAAIAAALARMAGGGAMASANDIRTTGAAPKDMINLIACRGACAALPDPGGNGLGGVLHPDVAAP